MYQLDNSSFSDENYSILCFFSMLSYTFAIKMLALFKQIFTGNCCILLITVSSFQSRKMESCSTYAFQHILLRHSMPCKLVVP